MSEHTWYSCKDQPPEGDGVVIVEDPDHGVGHWPRTAVWVRDNPDCWKYWRPLTPEELKTPAAPVQKLPKCPKCGDGECGMVSGHGSGSGYWVAWNCCGIEWETCNTKRKAIESASRVRWGE